MKIVNAFWTFQGEGFHSGRRALFVRLPFCNLQCPWCDTEFDKFQEWSEEKLSDLALQESSRFAVITGGEPAKSRELVPVVDLLTSLGFELAIESNGTYPISKRIDWVTLSPKAFQKIPYYIHPEAEKIADEFKYVVDESFDWAILSRHNLEDGRRYSLSPEWGNRDANLAAIFNYIKENPGWRISLQTHKWMGVL